MLMAQQNLDCENDYSTKIYLHIQCNPNQGPHIILQRKKKNYGKIHIELQNTLDSQKNTGTKKQAGRVTIPNLSIYLQSHSSKGNAILVQKQTCIPMEQNEEHKHEYMFIQPNYNHLIFNKQTKKTNTGEKTNYSTNCSEKKMYIRV